MYNLGYAIMLLKSTYVGMVNKLLRGEKVNVIDTATEVVNNIAEEMLGD